MLGAARALESILVVAVVSVLVGCGDPGKPSAELSTPSSRDSGAANSLDEGLMDEDVGDRIEDGIDDGVVVDAIGGLGVVDAGDEIVVGDVGSNGGEIDDTGGDPNGDGIGTGNGKDVVDVGGVLVKGVCGWPGLLCEPDESVAPIDEGGRLWWRSSSSWEPWVGRVLDACDDHEALTVIAGQSGTGGTVFGTSFSKGIVYDAKIPSYKMEDIMEYRNRYPIVCSDEQAAVPHWECWEAGFGSEGASQLRAYLDGFEEPPPSSVVMAWVEDQGLDCFDAAAERRRYVFVAADGPMFPQSSIDAATDAYAKLVEEWSNAPSHRMPGRPLGGQAYFPVESPGEDLAVLSGSVSVIDGVLRGLAQNTHTSLWARDVSVTAVDSAGVEAMGRLPLVVQPGEAMPFEIEGWMGSPSLSEISFEVSGHLSPRIDLSRSLRLWPYEWHFTREDFLAEFSEEMAGGELPDGEFYFVEVNIARAAPDSHPRLGDAALAYEIENLAVYGATFGGETAAVIDVFEMTPWGRLRAPISRPEWTEIASLPAKLPDGGLASTATVGTVTDYYNAPMIWAGEAA